MAKNPAGLLRWSSTVFRGLCTAAAAVAGEPLLPSAVSKAPPKAKQLYRRLSALGGEPKGAVTNAMNKWLREGRCVRATEVIKYVKELRKYRRFEHALELMEWMDTRGMNTSYSNYAIRLDLICKVEGISSAEKYFSSLSGPAKNQLTYDTLLNCYCTQTKEGEALSLFKKMKERNFASHALPYNNLMSLYMRLGQPEKVPPLLQEMMEKNIPPDEFTYSLLMNSYAALKDIKAVEQTFEEIKESDAVKVKWPIYSHLASIYISAGLIEKAESALKMLEENMDRGNRECFHFHVSLYAGVGKLDDVNRTWNSLKAAFPTTLNMSYSTMLHSLNRMDEFDALEQCFKEWASGCVTYDIRLANIMFGAYLKRDMIAEAESLWAEVIHRGAEPNSRTFELYIDYHLKKQKMDLALKYMDDAVSKVKNQHWKPHKEQLDAFLRYFEEHKDVEHAEAFCKNLERFNCLDSDAYSSLRRIRESRAVSISELRMIK